MVERLIIHKYKVGLLNCLLKQQQTFLSLHTNNTERLGIANNGDISFYEDTGTTAKLFWDASAESLGIGTTSPSAPLSVGSVSGDTYAIFDNGAKARLTFNGDASAAKIFATTTGFANYEDLEFRADNYLFKIGTTERMRIDSSGRVGIGTASPARNLVVQSGGAQMALVSGTTGNSVLNFGDTDADNVGRITYRNTSDSMEFVTANVERMRIDSSGNVGIGTSNPATSTHSSYQNLVIGETTSATSGLSFKASTTGQSAIFFSDGASPFNRGQVLYDHSSDHLAFASAGSERMRIDSSGNLLVGQTTAYTGAGVTISGDGVVQAERNNISGVFNRTSTNGDILQFRKDGASVGSIGSYLGDRLFVGTGDTNLNFHATGDAVYPSGANGNTRDGAINLGVSFSRFQDLYLSGGAYLGGTAAANHLDDYEEGTFTPAVRNSTQTGSVTYSAQNGHYVKVGKFVSVTFYLVFTKGSLSGGTLQFTGLPFTVDSLTNMYPQAAILIDNLEAALSNPLLQITNGQTTGDFIQNNGGTGNHAGLSVATYIDGATSAIQIRGTLNYIAA